MTFAHSPNSNNSNVVMTMHLLLLCYMKDKCSPGYLSIFVLHKYLPGSDHFQLESTYLLALSWHWFAEFPILLCNQHSGIILTKPYRSSSVKAFYVVSPCTCHKSGWSCLNHCTAPDYWNLHHHASKTIHLVGTPSTTPNVCSPCHERTVVLSYGVCKIYFSNSPRLLLSANICLAKKN